MTLNEFIEEWHSEQPTVRVHTSGSTGKPKELLVEKRRMEASARMTCAFLGLTSADKALLCMPLDYIAGKMMVVRSIVNAMPLLSVVPSAHPLAGLDEVPDLAAMTPMQAANTMEQPQEKELFCRIKHVIIGGGAISPSLEQELRTCPNAVWSSYGMTETLSHIALRRVSGEDASLWYTPLQGIDIGLSPEGTLRINAPALHEGTLTTNDIAEVNATGQFRIMGRKDNTINSGCVKIQIEKVEERLKEELATLLKDCNNVSADAENCFMITSSPHPIFGEAVTLLIKENINETLRSALLRSIDALPRYWRPKRIVEVALLPFTDNGKPDRATAKAITHR